MTTPILRTARLLLRPPVADDLDGWAAFAADATAMRFMGGPQSRPVAWRSMAGVAGSWTLQGFGLFSVLLRDGGRWIGRVGPLRPEGWPCTEVGWGILPAFQGRGFAREAAAACLDFAFATLGWQTVGHLIHPDNAPSIALAQALGSRPAGTARLPEPYAQEPVELWAQDAAAWYARQRSTNEGKTPLTH